MLYINIEIEAKERIQLISSFLLFPKHVKNERDEGRLDLPTSKCTWSAKLACNGSPCLSHQLSKTRAMVCRMNVSLRRGVDRSQHRSHLLVARTGALT